MAIEQYANGPVTYLVGTIADTDTSLSVTSGTTGFPPGGNFTVLVDYEILLVTAVSGASWTVSRGQEGSVAASHTNSAIYMPLTAAALQRLVVTLHGGTLVESRRRFNFLDTASLVWTFTDDPTNGKIDISAVASGSGSGGGGYEVAPPAPALTDFTWANQDTAFATSQINGVGLWDDAHNSPNMRCLVSNTPLPAVPWRVIARLDCYSDLNNNDYGLFIVTGDGNGFETISRFQDKIYLNRGTAGPTGSVTTPASQTLVQYAYDTKWFRISQHDSKRWFEVSKDGYSWTVVQVYWDYLAPTAPVSAGFYANANNNWGRGMMVTCGYFKVESLG